jgi:hypothetical protein
VMAVTAGPLLLVGANILNAYIGMLAWSGPARLG